MTGANALQATQWPPDDDGPGVALRDVTAAERAAYQRDGAVKLAGIIAPDWVERMRECIEDWKRRPGDFAIAWTDAGHAQSTAGGVNVMHSALARDCVFHSPAARIAADVHGADELRYFEDQIFYRMPGPVSATGWHQDTGYWWCEGRNLVRVWMPLDPVDREVSLEIVRGSHLWNVTYRAVNLTEKSDEGPHNFVCERDQNLPEVPDIESCREGFDILGWDFEPGDALVFNANMLHGVQASPRPRGKRRVYSLVFAGDGVTYRSRPTSNPDLTRLLDDPLEDGEPLARAERAFPVVYRRAADA